jgi:L-gulonolactone oxidase
MKEVKKNWAKTTICTPYKIIYPNSEEEIIEIVKNSYDKNIPLKVVGAAHSYNDIYHTISNGILISLSQLSRVELVDQQDRLVSIEAGVKIPTLIKELNKFGFSLPSLGTNIFDNFIGACSTGYHGSGINYGALSTLIQEIEIINGKGEKLLIKKGNPDFDALGIGLGAFGIITKILIQCESYFHLEVLERRVSLNYIEENFHDLLNNNEHFKFLWVPHTTQFMIWCGNRTNQPELSLFQKVRTYLYYGVLINNFLHEWFLFLASFNRNKIKKVNQRMSHLMIPNNKRSIWASHWAFFLPHILKQDVVEFAIDIKDTFEVFKKLMNEIEAKEMLVDTPIEVRFVKEDSFWLGPSYQRNSGYIGTKIHFPYGRIPEYIDYFKMVESLMLTYNGRPHWGKQFNIPTEYFKSIYPKWDNFWELVDRYDPKGIFQNAFLKRLRNS